MPTSATGTEIRSQRRGLQEARRGAAGFSLVELMTVLVIIGLAAGAIAMTLPGGTPDLGRQADAVAAHLDRLARSSILSNRVIGVQIEADGLRVYRRRRGTWEPARGPDATLAWQPETRVTVGQSAPSRQTPERSRQALQRSRRPGGRAGAQSPDTGPNPQIRFDPLGMGTAFWLRLERDGEEVVVQGTRDGRIFVGQGDDVS